MSQNIDTLDLAVVSLEYLYCSSRCILIFFMSMLCGCAAIQESYPREPSYAYTNSIDTELSKRLHPVVAIHNVNESGFHPIFNGLDALAMRLYLAKIAEKSIDVQYYLIKNDTTGLLFLNSLLEAADRGVRVRVLVDDVFTRGYDEALSTLHSLKNFEVRVINPFNRGLFGRVFSGITDFSRINRRMHNKSFTVDNQISIIGGRNIANEYFAASDVNNFSDLDVLVIGPLVQEISSMFDQYWNHERSLPIPAFIRANQNESASELSLRTQLKNNYTQAKATDYAEALIKISNNYLKPGAINFEWATYKLIFDEPDKIIHTDSSNKYSVLSELSEHLNSAKSDLIIVTPYFIPLDSGIKFLSEQIDRGINVTVITNSLAANNQLLVHSAYAPVRKKLLRIGIKIFEMKPNANVSGTRIVTGNSSTATLHTKSYILDQKEVFIGSFNFDPRSAHINSEMGVIINSQPVANRLLSAVHEGISKSTYELDLDPNGNIIWIDRDVDGNEIVYTNEPSTSWFKRLWVNIFKLLPIDEQL